MRAPRLAGLVEGSVQHTFTAVSDILEFASRWSSTSVPLPSSPASTYLAATPYFLPGCTPFWFSSNPRPRPCSRSVTALQTDPLARAYSSRAAMACPVPHRSRPRTSGSSSSQARFV